MRIVQIISLLVLLSGQGEGRKEVRKAGTNPQGFQLKQADILFHTYLHSVTTSFVTDYSRYTLSLSERPKKLALGAFI